MPELREEINKLIISADEAVQNNNFDEGIMIFKEAKQKAANLQWEERVGQIDQMIQETLAKKDRLYQIKLQEQKLREKKNKELQRQNEIENARKRELQKKEEDKKRRLFELQQKKKKENEYSGKAYDLLEKGSNLIEQNQFNDGIESFRKAIELFQEINWNSEIPRINELIIETQKKWKKWEYQQKFNDENQKNKKEPVKIDNVREGKTLSEREKRLQIEKQKYLQKKEKEKEEKSIIDQLFKDIDQIENEIQKYERDPDRFTKKAPYDEAIKIYRKTAKKLKNIGWTNEARRIFESIENYNNKLIKDTKIREIRKQKEINKQKTFETIQKKAELSQKQLESQKKQKLMQKQQELKQKQQKEEIVQQIFNRIEKMELEVREYERNPNRINQKCPYSKAIKIYRKSAKELRNIGWMDQAKHLADSIKVYQNKLEQDKLFRENEHQKALQQQKKLEEIEKKAQLSKQQIEAKRNRELAQQRKEQEELRQKQAIADQVFEKIDLIEAKVREYERNPNRINQRCPYHEAIEIYQDAVKKLQKIEWFDQVQRMRDSIETYLSKLEQDKQFREKKRQKALQQQKELEEIEKKAQLSKQQLEAKRKQALEEKQKEIHEQKRKQEIANQVYQNIDEIEAKVREYERNPNRINQRCPYHEAIEIYQNAAKELQEIEWFDQVQRMLDSVQTYQSKLEQDTLYREQERQKALQQQKELEEIEKKAQLSKQQLEAKRKRELAQQQKEQEEQHQKRAIADQVFEKIDIIETTVKDYEQNPNRVNQKCPYHEAIEIYQNAAKELQEIEWFEQAQRMLDSVQTYQRKLELDKVFREKERQKALQQQKELEEIEKKAQLSKQQLEAKQKQALEEKQKKIEEEKRKEEIAHQVYQKIDEIEENVREYERIPDRINLQCPYPEAITVYQQAATQLQEIEWFEQAQRMLDSVQTYQTKLKQDTLYREQERQKALQQQKELEEIEKKAQLSKQQLEAKRKRELAQQRKEQEEQRQKQAIADQVFEKIDLIETKVKDYERTPERINLQCPYPEAITVYQQAATQLQEIEWFEQAQRMMESVQTYQTKSKQDTLYREQERQKALQQQKELEEIEKKAQLSKQQLEAKRKRELAQQRKEQEEQRQKQAIADRVFEKIDLIETKVKDYERTPERINLQCPYPEAITVYQQAATQLQEIKWFEQAQRMRDSVQTYQTKSKQDTLYREQERQKALQQQKELEEIEKKAQLSKQQLEAKRKRELAQQRKEQEEQRQKQAIADQVFEKIDLIETKVKDYERTPERINLQCPYPEAIKIYQQAATQLQEIEWFEQAQRMMESVQTYQTKSKQDTLYREQERQKALQQRKELEEIEKKAQLSKQQLEAKRKRELAQQRKEQEEQRQKQAIADQVFEKINLIETKVKDYEQTPERIKLQCPYPEAIKIYQLAAEKFDTIGWKNQAQKLYDSMNLYKNKFHDDQVYREKVKVKQRNQERQKQLLKRKEELAEKIQQEQELEAKRQKEQELEQIKYETQQSQLAFNIMDEGNRFAQFHEYDKAILKFEEARDILKNIGWEREAEQTSMQIPIFKQNKIDYQNYLKNKAEEELKRKREIEKIEKRARISKKIKEKKKLLEKQKKEEKARQKRLQEQSEIERLINLANEAQKEEIQKTKLEIQKELEKASQKEKIHEECLDLLDKARTFAAEHKINAAIEKYQQVIEKYSKIDYTSGIKLTRETIRKVKQEHHNYLEALEQQKIQEEQRKQEQAEIERLIQVAQKEKEREKLLKKQAELEEREKQAHIKQIQEKIINKLEIAGQLRKQTQFDQALNLYQEGLTLLKNIHWPLKQPQILEMISETKEEKTKYIQKQKAKQELERKRNEEQRKFQELMKSQDLERKAALKKDIAEDQAHQEKIDKQKEIGDMSYKLLEIASDNIEANKHYMAFYFLDIAWSNFNQMNWEREKEITKQRIEQIYKNLSEKIFELSEFLNLNDNQEKLEVCRIITEMNKFRRYKNFTQIYENLEKLKISFDAYDWNKSINKLNKLEEIIEQEEKHYLIEQEKRKQKPSIEKANTLMNQAKSHYKQGKLEQAIQTGQKAKDMFLFLNLSKYGEDVQTDLLLWKYEHEKDVKSENPNFEILTPEERKKARILYRKRKRRRKR